MTGRVPAGQRPGCPLCGCGRRRHRARPPGRRAVLAQRLAGNYQRPGFRAGEMAAAAGITVRTLQHFCRRESGRTPRQLLTDVRLHKAGELIASGSAVAEAARAAGYTRTDRFRTAYRSRYGTEPGTVGQVPVPRHATPERTFPDAR